MESDLARAFTHTLTTDRSEMVDRQRAPSILAAGLVAFYNEKVDIILEGKPLPRPTTHFFK
jgi:hypothetical protein